jgi:hypothetical protein
VRDSNGFRYEELAQSDEAENRGQEEVVSVSELLLDAESPLRSYKNPPWAAFLLSGE